MKVHLYQIQYDEKTKPSEESGFSAFDVRDKPEFLKREMAHWLRFYEEVISKSDDQNAVYGLFSPKFNEKTGLVSQDVIQFVESNSDQDIYIINPYPMNVYLHTNVWRHCDENHPEISQMADILLNKAGYGFDILKEHRHSVNQVIYCNYWLANKFFCDRYYVFIKNLDDFIEGLPNHEKYKFFEPTNYLTEAVRYPFLFERLMSTYLYEYSTEIKVSSFNFSYEQALKIGMGTVDKFFYRDFKARFDNWEDLQINSIEVINAVKKIRLLCYPNVGNFLFSRFIRSLVKRINVYRLKRELSFLEEHEN